MPESTTLTVEERVARQSEINARQAEIDTEHNGAALPDDVQAEWDRLNDEHAEHERHIAQAEARRRTLEERAQSPGNTERPGTAPHTRSPRTTEDIYDLTEIRRRAHSVDDLAGLYRDNAKRAVERASFPTLAGRGLSRRERITREDCQRQVEYLLDFVDDENGTLARRILVTGSPMYDRAFGKTVTAQSDVGLTSAERAALALGAGGTGAFAVPFQLDPTVLLTSNGSINPLRQISRVEQIVGKEWDGVTSTGITVGRSLEAVEATDNAPALLQPTVKAERVIGFVPFSMEIDQDWNGLRSEMTRLLSDAKDQEEATSFVTGNGTPPNPNGIVATLGAGSLITADTFTVASVYLLEQSVPPRFRAQSSILANKAIFNLVRQFDTAGGAALWVRLADGLPPELIGYSAYEASSMTGTLPIAIGDRYLLMGDFQQFLIVDRVGMSIELVPHLFGATNRFPTGQRGIFAIWRNNSKILFDNAFRVLRKNA